MAYSNLGGVWGADGGGFGSFASYIRVVYVYNNNEEK